MKVFFFFLFCIVGRIAFAQYTHPTELVVEKIECSGNQNTDCEFIADEFQKLVGEKFDPDVVSVGEIRLMLTGLFDRVEAKLKKGSNKTTAVLEVSIKERSAFFVQNYLRYRRDNSFASSLMGLSTTIGYRNLFGTGKNLSLSTGILLSDPSRNSPPFSLRYSNPKFLGNRSFYHEIELNHFRSSSQVGYGMATTLGYRLWDFWFIEGGLSYNWGKNNFYNSEIQQLESREWATYSGKFGYNSIDNDLFPFLGHRFSLSGNAYPWGTSTKWISHASHFPLNNRLSLEFNNNGSVKGAFEKSTIFSGAFLNYDISSLRLGEGRDSRVFFGVDSTTLSTHDSGGWAGTSLGWRVNTESIGLIELKLLYSNAWGI